MPDTREQLEKIKRMACEVADRWTTADGKLSIADVAAVNSIAIVAAEAIRTLPAPETPTDEFTVGVFSAMEYLVLTRGEDQLAKELAHESGIKQVEALKLSKRSGFEVRKMCKFIREELRQ